MPKLRPTPEAQADKELVAKIAYCQKKYDVSDEALALALRICRKTLSSRMKRPETFTLKELRLAKKRLHFDLEGVI